MPTLSEAFLGISDNVGGVFHKKARWEGSGRGEWVGSGALANIRLFIGSQRVICGSFAGCNQSVTFAAP